MYNISATKIGKLQIRKICTAGQFPGRKLRQCVNENEMKSTTNSLHVNMVLDDCFPHIGT